MKRIIWLIATVTFFTGLNLKAQVSAVNYSQMENRYERSLGNTENERRSDRVSTWTDHAELLVDIYNVHNDVLYQGMGTAEAQILLQQPNSIETAQDGPDQVETYVYDRVTLTFRNGELEIWEDTSPIVQNPLEQAREAIDQAIALNDGSDDDEIIEAIVKLQGAYEMEAIMHYQRDDLNGSYANFSKVLGLYELPVMQGVQADSLIIYNAGRMAAESGEHEDAVMLFTQLDEMNYNEPFIYVYLEQSLFAIGDTATGAEMLNKGFNRFPEEQAIMNELINYYINTDQADEALELLNVAKNREPDNVSYLFAEAVMYEKTGRLEEAEETYLACLDMEPDFYDAAYNLGVLFYNKAVQLYEEASKTTDNAQFQELETQGDEMLKQAIPYMERASEIDPNDTYTLENLRNMYYRLDMTDEYNEVVKKLQSM